MLLTAATRRRSRTYLQLVIATTVATVSYLIGWSAVPASAATTPAFVQQASVHKSKAATATVALPAALGSGNRLVVEAVTWNSGGATTRSVTDSANDTFTEVLHIAAADKTELSVWTAPVTGGAGQLPVIMATPTATADIGIVALEYSGLSTAAGVGAVDGSASAVGKTTAAASVSSGSTTAVTTTGELALGFYGDSGFSSRLTAGTGYTQRANVSPFGDEQLLVEDQSENAGATPNATVTTGANTYWQMATVVFRTGAPVVPVAPGTPTSVVATAGDTTASLSWTAPSDGGSTITTYTITPYLAGVAQPQSVVTGAPAATSGVVTGLTDGSTYTFTVSATNSIGTGPQSIPSNAVVPAPATTGSWSPLQTWPISALAMHVLYTGRTISWDGWQQPEPTVAWDPANPSVFSTINAPDSVFCDGAADLPDGRLLVIGGYGQLSTGQIGIVDTNIYDPSTGTWSRVADMHYPRWYPTVTELSDGRYLALSGNSTDANTWADTPEVYDPTTNKWTLLTGINTSSVHEVEYPFSYEVPSGKVFVIGPEEDNSHLLDANAQTWTSTGSAGMFNGSSVMYRPGKILYSGGAALINTPSPAQKTTAVIDLNAATPAWRQTAPMNNARIYHTLTMLADGTVLAVGGSNTSDQQVITTGVLPTEIWNPDTETWTPDAPIAAARNYHSTAVLLPDGRVLVAGGGHPTGLQDAAQYSSQIYTPAYLTRGARPVISSAPAGTSYGTPMTLTSPDASSITAVNLVSLGAGTHQIDMNQHFVPLSFTASGNTLTVQSPATSAIAPPGYYMLFILKNGVPSVSTMVHISPAQTQTVPGTPTGVVAAAGNTSANVSWTAPDSGNTPITSYTVTPYLAGVAQPVTTVTGNPPATTARVSGLTNGSAYTFTVTAVNAIGASSPSAASAPVTPSATPAPTFVQSSYAQAANVASLPTAPNSPVTVGDRMIVQAGVWSSAHATARSVTDSAGNVYTKLVSSTASDGTEQSIWTAPITAGGGSQPIVTVTATGTADIGVTASEYAGLSPAAGTGVLDVQSSASGTTGSAGTVSSGVTPAVTGNKEIALGFYADSGFNSTLTSAAGWTMRGGVPTNAQMDLGVEDQNVDAGAVPNASFGTKGGTIWQVATLVFKSGSPAPPSVPGAPSNVVASPGNGSAALSWTAASTGGSPLTGYTVTTYSGSSVVRTDPVSAANTSTTISGLINGTSYNFSVSATNAIGTGPVSTLSNTVVPTNVASPSFVQQASGHGSNARTLTVTPSAAYQAGDRLVVEVGVWDRAHDTTSAVTDAAGDVFTELMHFTASDGTELSIWTAPVGAGAGSASAVTATVTGAADIGVAALEYSGISATAPVDVTAHATGTTTTAMAVSSGATMPTTGTTGIALGFYADSGFGTALTADAGYRSRVNLSPLGDMQMLVEDATVTAGATPGPGIGTGARTIWLAATVVFQAG